MKSKLIILSLVAFLLGAFWIGCQEEITQTDDPLTSAEQLEKKDKKPCLSIEKRVNTGTPLPLECETGYIPVKFTLWAGQDIDAGTVTISNDDINLYVTYTTDGTVDLEDVHVYVWTEAEAADVPCKRPEPGKADYVVEGIHDESVMVTIPVDIPQDENYCEGDPITFYIAAHAALSNDETAYGGDDDPESANTGGDWFY